MKYLIKNKGPNNFERRKAAAIAGRQSEKRKPHRFIKSTNLAALEAGRIKQAAFIRRGIEINSK